MTGAADTVRTASPGRRAGDPLHLTRESLLARNVLLNLVGWGLPAALALVAIPTLIRGYGESRFGVLAIAWAVIGYFGLFDLGLSRALTQRLAHAIASGARGEIGPVSWTAFTMMSPVALMGALALYLSAGWISTRVLVIPPELRAESIVAFRLFAIAVPFTVVTAGLRGILEAGQRFGAINALRVPLGLLTFGGPLLALVWSPSLVAAALVLTTGRVVLTAVTWVVAIRAFPELATPVLLPRDDWMPLLRFGGWMTVSNVVSPLMNSMDRFGLGILLPVATVAYYATSFEVVTKVWLITAAVLPVLFPALTATLAAEPARAAALFSRATRVLLLLSLPALALMVLFAHAGLAWWVNPAFADSAASALRWLAVAMCLNVVAQVALTLVQAAGRPDLVAKFHIAELPLYALLVWLLVERYGPLGAALAWGARVAIDAGLLLWAAARVVPAVAPAVRRAALLGTTAALVLGGLALLT